jgi:hypothetical protein
MKIRKILIITGYILLLLIVSGHQAVVLANAEVCQGIDHMKLKAPVEADVLIFSPGWMPG